MTMGTAVAEALSYVKQEISAGSLKDIDKNEKTSDNNELLEKNTHEEDTSIFNKLRKNKKHDKNK